MSAGRFNLSALAVRERSVTLFLIILISVAGLVAFFGLRAGGRSALHGQANDGHYRLARRHRAGDAGSGRRAAGKTAPGAEVRYDRTETYTRPGMALITLSLQDQTPPSEVPEQFYQARKSSGMRRKPACRRLRPDDE
ncbi:hypothetical protein LNP17_18280 [Klebsiella variicola subsp. variicola]|nr:hypothetical protein [Klebsiella variicola subsp. variicola]